MTSPSNHLQLTPAGTLARPGPIGRLVRLALGILCLLALWTLVVNAARIIQLPFSSLGELALLLVIAICSFNYVVNIGFSMNWGYRPLAVSLGLLIAAFATSYVFAGKVDSSIAGIPLWLWLAYFYAHLGSSFVLAAILATPGCEARAFPELLGRISGTPAREHPCPVALISRLDAWEQQLRSGS
jgi:hypothetical protein